MAYVLGIDIGTGSAKAVGVDLQGNAVEVAQQY
jgi:sugar (pentulose or hexulose) kinase